MYIPLEGLRVKLQYQGVKKLWTICFGKHLRKICEGTKVTWPEYIRSFREENPSITDDFYGVNIGRFDSAKKRKLKSHEPFVRPRNGAKWTTLIERVRVSGGPNPEDFSLPTTENEWDSMLKKLEECGVERAKAIEMMKERRVKFIK